MSLNTQRFCRVPEGYVALTGLEKKADGTLRDFLPAFMTDDYETAADVFVPEFEISEFPVTMGDFIRWAFTFNCSSRLVQQDFNSASDLIAKDIKEHCDHLMNDPDLLETLPMVGVTREEAMLYCQDHGWLLPTKEQWTRAARADSLTDLPPSYTGSREDLINWPDAKLWDSPYFARLQPVDWSPLVSPFGVRGQLGNSDEWTIDIRPYKDETGVDDFDHQLLVMQVGVWSPYLSISSRMWRCPTTYAEDGSPERVANQGFRACRQV